MLQEISKNLIENDYLFRELILSHLKITLVTVLMAVVIGLFLGILIEEHRRYTGFVIAFVNIV